MKSPIIYNQLKNNFSQISNHALLDTSLSAKAYKLYAYMCYRIGLSDSWQFNTYEILKHFKEGDKAMRVAFKELIDAGFLERKRVRNEKGIFERTDYTIYAEPVNTGSNPQVQNRRVDNRHVDNPHVDNASLNKKEGINKDLSNKELISLPLESKREILKKIWAEKNLKSDCEKYLLFREKSNWKGVSNLEADIAWWENGFKEKNPQLYIEKKPASSKTEFDKKLEQEMKEKMADIKFIFGEEGPLLYLHEFLKVDEGFLLKVTNPKALKFEQELKKINVKIEVK